MCDCCATKKDIYLPQMATVNKARLMNGTELYMHISMDDTPLVYEPGQFVEVSLPGLGEAPISISSSPTQGDGFELVVRKIGNVTNKIHQLKKGDKIGIRGPFGNGKYPFEECKGQNLIFICGGIGLVPQRSFINYVLDNRDDYGEVTILLGTKCHTQRFFHSEIEAWTKRDDLHFMETVDEADDCWQGNVGVVTTLIPKIETELSSAKIFVCGPPIMYKFVIMALDEAKVSHDNIYLNLERKMKCGVGKCGHCQINQYYVCVDGPVFKYSDLQVAPEAI
ncbi:MAG: FAD/NAD(P)-binding protein [Planctomycetes bacterium]|nr:FAD/NAD(P)-binding protein [Planctomycetota bacterium]MBL7106286.1 FAD/NAD(P)-binding protein [Phycisphaerae bacterium]